MKTIDVSEFFLTEVEEEQCADVQCVWCEYRGVVTFTDAFLAENTQYTNPNYEIITTKHRHLLRWVSINLEAVKCINNVIYALCCPGCRDDSLQIPTDSTYNLKRILESLQCHAT